MIIMVQVYETVMYTLDEIFDDFNASNSESASIAVMYGKRKKKVVLLIRLL